MKKSLPDYRIIGLSNVKLKKIDQAILNKFLKLCEGSAGEKKVKNIERIMLIIYDVSGVSFSDWDLDVLRNFLSVLNLSNRSVATKNDIKKVLKRFLKENYFDWSERFKGFKDSSMKQKDEVNHEKLNASTMLKPHEFELLVRHAENYRWKAFISLSYESAGRPEEILKLKWADIDLEGGNVKLSSSKTGNIRVNPIKDCVVHLKQYREHYPFPSVESGDYLFPSVDRNRHLTIQTFYSYLQGLGNRVLNRHIFPYLFRHTRLTFLMSRLSSKAYEKFAGHSIETANKHYSHLSDDDVREEMYEKVFKVQDFNSTEKNILEEAVKRVVALEKRLKLIENNFKK
jgi:integrase